jgi:hypothetical protein
MSTKPSSDNRNMSHDADKNKQLDTGTAAKVVEDRTEATKNTLDTRSPPSSRTALRDFLDFDPQDLDLSIQLHYSLGAPCLYALVYFMFISAWSTWLDCTFLIPLVFTIGLGHSSTSPKPSILRFFENSRRHNVSCAEGQDQGVSDTETPGELGEARRFHRQGATF